MNDETYQSIYSTQLTCDMACQILSATRDGAQLAPRHLYLLQEAVNRNLSKEGEVYFARLYNEVCTFRTYDAAKAYHFDVEHVTKDHQGFIYWKGINVEHFTYHGDWQAEREATIKLAASCRLLEQKGLPVSMSNLWDLNDEIRAAEIMVLAGGGAFAD